VASVIGVQNLVGSQSKRSNKMNIENDENLAVEPVEFTQADTLPLWKNWLEKNEHRIVFGLQVTSLEMEEALKSVVSTPQYNFAIHDIRLALRRRGMHFSGRGFDGEGFEIKAPETNAHTMLEMNERAKNAYKESLNLGINTPLDTLTLEQRNAHESIVAKSAMRFALLSRKQHELE